MNCLDIVHSPPREMQRQQSALLDTIRSHPCSAMASFHSSSTVDDITSQGYFVDHAPPTIQHVINIERRRHTLMYPNASPSSMIVPKSSDGQRSGDGSEVMVEVHGGLDVHLLSFIRVLAI